MICFVKNFTQFKTVKRASVISYALTLDSLDQDTSTVTVAGTEIGRSDIGSWLIIDGGVYWIKSVKPNKDRTMLTLLSPLYAFARTLEYARAVYPSIGAFLESMLENNWIRCPDTVYAIPYLTLENYDTTEFQLPELDAENCFLFTDYAQLMRQTHRVYMQFSDGGSQLLCQIRKQPDAYRQIAFDDGHSQLQSLDYSSSGIAKVTVLQDVSTGASDADGNPIMQRTRTDWYLSEDGEISRTVPARRAVGSWETIFINSNDDQASRVAETFAKNKSDHKLEFWSDRDLPVHADCTFYVYGELLRSYISYKRSVSNDTRFYYKSGELATTATDKLRR